MTDDLAEPADTKVLPQNQTRVYSVRDLGPVLAKIFMLHFSTPTLASQNASLAPGNFQSFEEFLLTVHRLESNEGVNGLRVVRLFVLLDFLQLADRLLLKLVNLKLNLQFFCLVCYFDFLG